MIEVRNIGVQLQGCFLVLQKALLGSHFVMV